MFRSRQLLHKTEYLSQICYRRKTSRTVFLVYCEAEFLMWKEIFFRCWLRYYGASTKSHLPGPASNDILRGHDVVGIPELHGLQFDLI